MVYKVSRFGSTLHPLELNLHACHDSGAIPPTAYYAESGSYGSYFMNLYDHPG